MSCETAHWSLLRLVASVLGPVPASLAHKLQVSLLGIVTHYPLYAQLVILPIFG